MATASINGTTLHYEADGHGPPCLVLHGGLGLDHIVYRRTLTPLTEHLRLVYVDHRGNGRSGRAAVGHDHDGAARRRRGGRGR